MSYQYVNVINVCKSYGPKDVLDRVSLTISHTDRITIIGENGVGKSTLARLIAGVEPPDNGVIERREGLRLGYLPQEVELEGSEASLDAFLFGRCQHLASRMKILEAELASACDHRALLKEWDSCHEEFERAGGYDAVSRAEIVLAGLGLAGVDRSIPVGQLSGGQRVRATFAKLLLEAPDVLVLDEPTNHLDLAAVEWLERYLSDYPGAVFMISHDRTFLNRVCTTLAELSPRTHQLSLYTGNYDAFLQEKQRQQESMLQDYEAWREEQKSLYRRIRAASFSERRPPPPKDRNTMAYDRRGEKYAQSKSRCLRQAKARLEELEAEKRVHPIPKGYKGIFFDPVELTSKVGIAAVCLSKGYGGCSLFENLSFELLFGDRIVLQGVNGCGKSTLFEILVGNISPDGGRVVIAPSANIGYLDQQLALLPPEQRVGEELMSSFRMSEPSVREELHKTGLADEGLFQKHIGDLSLGQKKRLALLHLMLSKCNVLLLDEPTNHLDLTVLETLEAALQTFKGALCAISHDRRFTERVATRVWKLENGSLRT